MLNPLSWIGGLGLNIKIGLIVALSVASFVAGWRVAVWRNSHAQGVSIAKQEKTAQKAIVMADKIEETKQTRLGDTKIVYRTIREKINDENDQRICFADANALQLWNDAIAGADQSATERIRATSETGANEAERADNANVVASRKQVLTNAAENFQICNENAIKHNALIDTLEVYKGKMCVCAE